VVVAALAEVARGEREPGAAGEGMAGIAPLELLEEAGRAGFVARVQGGLGLVEERLGCARAVRVRGAVSGEGVGGGGEEAGVEERASLVVARLGAGVALGGGREDGLGEGGGGQAREGEGEGEERPDAHARNEGGEGDGL